MNVHAPPESIRMPGERISFSRQQENALCHIKQTDQ